MSQRLRHRRGLLVLVGVLGLWVASLAITLATGADLDNLDLVFALLLFGLIAALLVDRRPDNRVSWVMAAMAFLGVGAALSASLDDASQEVVAFIAIAGGGLFFFGFAYLALGVLPLIFPTGSLLSPRWRWLLWVGFGALALFLLLFVLQDQGCIETAPDTEDCLRYLSNPIGIPGLESPEDSALGNGVFAVLGMAILGSLFSVIIRFRRSRAVERQQMKLLALWAAVAGVSLFVETVWVQLFGQNEPTGSSVLSALLWLMLPISIAIAILRYRLYDIDRVISRTLGYGLVVTVLAGLYGLVVVGIPTLLPAVEDSQLLVAAATLGAFFLFNPLRKRMLRVVDRRFYRSRYDAERVVEEFAARLRDEVDLEELTADWVGVVQETVQPSSVSMWIREQ